MKNLKFSPSKIEVSNNDTANYYNKLKAELIFDIETDEFENLKFKQEKKEEIERAFLFAIHEVFKKHRKQFNATFFRFLPTDPADTNEEIINKFFIK